MNKIGTSASKPQMPRQPRLNLPGYYYHLIVRGIERRNIFRAPRDYWNFLNRLKDGLKRSGSLCFAWALMPNHAHLLILNGARGLYSLMHPLLTGYAATFNKRYDRVGHLFQNRFKAILCQEDSYFLQLLRYIVSNPVRAGLVQTLDDLRRYPWTSHKTMMSGEENLFLEREGVLTRFGSTENVALARYEQYISDGWSLGENDRFEGNGRVLTPKGRDTSSVSTRLDEQMDSRILGDPDFVQDVLRMAEEQMTPKRGLIGVSKETLAQSMALDLGVSIDALLSTSRQRAVADARAQLIYAATEHLGLSGRTLGEWLKLSSSGISQARTRGRLLSLHRTFHHRQTV